MAKMAKMATISKTADASGLSFIWDSERIKIVVHCGEKYLNVKNYQIGKNGKYIGFTICLNLRGKEIGFNSWNFLGNGKPDRE